MKNDPASEFAIDWWKQRHAAPGAYFPNMDQHKNWKLYDEMPNWFTSLALPEWRDTALEIGCGYGQWMWPMSELVHRVDGFDIHESLVWKFQEQFRALARANVRMFLGDGLTIPFDGPYSLVYSISVFQHMPRAIVHGYLKEIRRVLATDRGRALLHFRHADGVGEYSKDIGVNHSGDWSVGWTLDEVTKATAAAGLKVKEAAASQSLIVLCTL